MDDYFEANRRHWDELVPIHQASAYYEIEAFRAGKLSLRALEREELGDVAGKTLLHLQCHFGLDTMSWARLGATVTGADFSPVAISAARSLAEEIAIEARFVESDVYSLPEKLDGEFDIVFTSYGTYFWLPDLSRWAEVIRHFLAPGGTFYIADFHPTSGMLEDSEEGLRLQYPYFGSGEPLLIEEDGSYADREAKVTNRTTYSWPHPLGEIVTALIEAGLRIEYVHEFDYSPEQWFRNMDQGDDGMWRLRETSPSVPLLFSIRATNPPLS